MGFKAEKGQKGPTIEGQEEVWEDLDLATVSCVKD